MADTKDYEQLAQKLQILAQNGDAKSQYHLGVLYNDGKGVEKDYRQAASWYLKAAQQGHQKAQLYLGLMYQNGRGVHQDYKQAAQWFTKSAEQGEQKAQYFLGVLCYKGIGVTQDMEQAAHWLELSANQGNTDAQNLLDEILSIQDIEDIEADEFDIYDEEVGVFDDPEQDTPPRAENRRIWAIVLGVLLVLIAAGGSGYYFFLRQKPGNPSVIHTRIIDSLYPGKNDAIDVFKLAETGTPQQLREAVRRGANFNVMAEGFEGDGETPLHRAAYHNRNSESIRFLISQGLDVNAKISNGEDDTVETPLSYAVSEGNYEAVSELLKAGADYNSYSANGNMFQATILSNRYNTMEARRVIEVLIRAGGSVNAHMKSDTTKTMLLPREQWSSLNPFNNLTPDSEHEDILSFKFSCTALICSVLKDNPDLVNILLDLNADPNIHSMEGKTALDYAQELPTSSRLKRSSAFNRLRNVTAASTPNTNVDVYQLAKTGSSYQLRDAVSRGANFNVREGEESEHLLEGYTPLHEAARHNHDSGSIRFLVSQGLDVNAEASSGNTVLVTPLSEAVSYENLEAVKELLKAGADPNKYTSSGNMFHIMACSGSNNYSVLKEITEELVKYGGNINGHHEEVRRENIFLPRGKWSDNNPFNNLASYSAAYQMHTLPFSCTALMFAVLCDNPGTVNILLDAGADPNISSAEGKTAFDYAQELPKNARLRKWEAFERLRKLTTGRKKSNYDSIDDSSRKQLDKLIKAKKVPDYVRDSGKFYFNRKYSGGTVEIAGTNVRLRSQPNTQSRIVAEGWGGMWIDNHNLYYLGEWTNPKGERWVLADYEGYKNGKPIRKQPVWVFGKYTELMTEKEFNEMMTIELSGE